MLPSEFRNLWEDFANKDLSDCFIDFYDNPLVAFQLIQEFVYLCQEIIDEQIESILKGIMELLNITKDEISNKALIENTLRPILRESYHNIFDDEKISEKFHRSLIKKFKEFFEDKIKNEEKIEEFYDLIESRTLKNSIANLKKILFYIKFNGDPLQFKIESQTERKAEIKQFNKNDCICVQGFLKTPKNCLVLLSPPLMKKGYSFLNLKPVVIEYDQQLPENELNIIKQQKQFKGNIELIILNSNEENTQKNIPEIINEKNKFYDELFSMKTENVNNNNTIYSLNNQENKTLHLTENKIIKEEPQNIILGKIGPESEENKQDKKIDPEKNFQVTSSINYMINNKNSDENLLSNRETDQDNLNKVTNNFNNEDIENLSNTIFLNKRDEDSINKNKTIEQYDINTEYNKSKRAFLINEENHIEISKNKEDLISARYTQNSQDNSITNFTEFIKNSHIKKSNLKLKSNKINFSNDENKDISSVKKSEMNISEIKINSDGKPISKEYEFSKCSKLDEGNKMLTNLKNNIDVDSKFKFNTIDYILDISQEKKRPDKMFFKTIDKPEYENTSRGKNINLEIEYNGINKSSLEISEPKENIHSSRSLIEFNVKDKTGFNYLTDYDFSNLRITTNNDNNLKDTKDLIISDSIEFGKNYQENTNTTFKFYNKKHHQRKTTDNLIEIIESLESEMNLKNGNHLELDRDENLLFSQSLNKNTNLTLRKSNTIEANKIFLKSEKNFKINSDKKKMKKGSMFIFQNTDRSSENQDVHNLNQDKYDINRKNTSTSNSSAQYFRTGLNKITKQSHSKTPKFNKQRLDSPREFTSNPNFFNNFAKSGTGMDKTIDLRGNGMSILTKSFAGKNLNQQFSNFNNNPSKTNFHSNGNTNDYSSSGLNFQHVSKNNFINNEESNTQSKEYSIHPKNKSENIPEEENEIHKNIEMFCYVENERHKNSDVKLASPKKRNHSTNSKGLYSKNERKKSTNNFLISNMKTIQSSTLNHMQSINNQNSTLNLYSSANINNKLLNKVKNSSKNKLNDEGNVNKRKLIQKESSVNKQPMNKSIDRKIFENRTNAQTKINVEDLLSVKKMEKSKESPIVKEILRGKNKKDYMNIAKTHYLNIKYV